jgi:hypothetical protein
MTPTESGVKNTSGTFMYSTEYTIKTLFMVRPIPHISPSYCFFNKLVAILHQQLKDVPCCGNKGQRMDRKLICGKTEQT